MSRLSEDHVGALRRAYAALAEGDASAGLELLHPDFVWVEPRVRGYSLGGKHHGRDGFVRGILRAAARFWEEIRVEPECFLGADDDRVVVTGRLRGRVKGGATEATTEFAHLWTFDEGRLIHGQSYADMNVFVAEKGLHDLIALADGLIGHATALEEQWAELAGTDAGRSNGGEPLGVRADQDLPGDHLGAAATSPLRGRRFVRQAPARVNGRG